jgi:hypothetical protein
MDEAPIPWAYRWPDDVCVYSTPVDGCYWEPLPGNPHIYDAVRLLEPGEQQVLPNGYVSRWMPPQTTRHKQQDHVPLNSRITALYRLYSSADELLYVGVAADPDKRWKQHALLSHWWPQVRRREVEWHESRSLALGAEAVAIVAEAPIFNVAGKPRD